MMTTQPDQPNDLDQHAGLSPELHRAAESGAIIPLTDGDFPEDMNYWERQEIIQESTLDAVMAELAETHGLSDEPIPDPADLTASEFWDSLTPNQADDLEASFAILSPQALNDLQHGDPDIFSSPSSLFRWTPLRNEIAVMLSNGYTTREVCAALSSSAYRVTPSSIRSLLSNPIFSEEVNRLTLLTDVASRASRIRLAKRVIASLEGHTEKDLLDWLRYLQSETDGAQLNMSVLLEALQAQTDAISPIEGQLSPDASDTQPDAQPDDSTVTSDTVNVARGRPGRADPEIEYEDEATPFASMDDDKPEFPSTFSPI